MERWGKRYANRLIAQSYHPAFSYRVVLLTLDLYRNKLHNNVLVKLGGLILYYTCTWQVNLHVRVCWLLPRHNENRHVAKGRQRPCDAPILISEHTLARAYLGIRRARALVRRAQWGVRSRIFKAAPTSHCLTLSACERQTLTPPNVVENWSYTSKLTLSMGGLQRG